MSEIKIQKIHDQGVTYKSTQLKGCHIALAVSGGIGAVECVKLIRELRRHQAEVTVFVTPSVSKFVGHLSLEWASGKPVISELLAPVDHFKNFSLVLFAPLTLNTLVKIAVGICDNPVTMLAASSWAKKDLVSLFVPAMNEVLQAHPKYTEHRRTVENWGGKFFNSELEEGRLKMPDTLLLVEWILCQSGYAPV